MLFRSLTVEVSNIYPQGGRLRKIHNILFAPSLEVVERINAVLSRFGSLMADGRPTLTLPSDKLVEYVMEVSPDCMIVPAHAWTPWFSLFGSNSGFDALTECFGDQAKHIASVETGLSSDPPMNWRLRQLDPVMLMSNSDAHSPAKLGREANVFEMSEPDYYEMMRILREKDTSRFLYTVEFFPEEGKYHYDGHRGCGVLWAPAETRKHGGRCSACGKPVTVGVMHRVESLADRPAGYTPPGAIPGKHLVPLAEIIGEAMEIGAESAGVEAEWRRLIDAGGNELAVLMEFSEAELARFTPPRVLEGIRRMRAGQLSITPGYDGVYGKVSLFAKEPEIGRAHV